MGQSTDVNKKKTLQDRNPRKGKRGRSGAQRGKVEGGYGVQEGGQLLKEPFREGGKFNSLQRRSKALLSGGGRRGK